MLDRHTTPPGGWMFRQVQTGWSMPNPIAQTFNQAVTLIVQHRIANRAIAQKFNLATDPNVVAAELEKFTRKRLGLPEGATPAPFSGSHSPSQGSGVAAVAENSGNPGILKRIAQAVSATPSLISWIASRSEAVPVREAERRAAICARMFPETGEKCPMNLLGAPELYFTKPIADAARVLIGKKNAMSLRTTNDSRLGMCSACGCVMTLKVWMPMDRIEREMDAESRAALHPKCWITNREEPMLDARKEQ